MIELAKILALIAVLGTAVVYGTDVFCAVVQRPALAVVDDRALVAVMGNVHHYGDRRMRVPGVLGGVAAIASAALFAVAGIFAVRHFNLFAAPPAEDIVEGLTVP